jgi:hypothetical protein
MFRLKRGPSLFRESGFWNIQILTDLLGQEITDFRVAGHGGSSVFGRASPPRVAAAFADQLAAVFFEVLEKFRRFTP